MGRLRVNRVSQPANFSALKAGNPLSKYLISAISPKDNYDLALGRPIIKGGVVNSQPTPFGIAAKSPTAASSNLLYSNIASIGAADSTMVLVVYNHALIVDANNHYAGGSYRSGSLTTALQLSNGAGTHYWQSLTGNGSATTLSANEVLPVGLSVLVLTQRSGLISIYRNGVLKNSVSAANGNSNTTFCICDIDDVAIANSTDRAVLLGLKFSVGMTAPQVKDISNNPWQLFAPIARNSYQAAAVGGGSIIPNGQTATTTSGTTTPSIDLAASGNSSTGSVGIVTAALSLELTGSSATATQGSVTPSLSLALTGNSTTATAGTVSASTPGAISLSSNSATSTQGAVVPSLSLSATGNSSTATSGAVVPGVSLAITGQTATGSQGAVVAALAIVLSGQVATASSGIISAPSGDLTVALSGNALAVSAGVVEVPSSAAGGYDDKKKTKKLIKQQVKRLNEQIVESLQSEVVEEIKAIAPVTKAFVQSLVSAQAIQQIDDEDEDEALMLLMM